MAACRSSCVLRSGVELEHAQISESAAASKTYVFIGFSLGGRGNARSTYRAHRLPRRWSREHQQGSRHRRTRESSAVTCCDAEGPTLQCLNDAQGYAIAIGFDRGDAARHFGERYERTATLKPSVVQRITLPACAIKREAVDA
jgi:hypothetical protein